MSCIALAYGPWHVRSACRSSCWLGPHRLWALGLGFASLGQARRIARPNRVRHPTDCEFASGATAILSFCPVAGVVVERATVHLQDHTFFLDVPIWGAYDSPGRLRHLEKGEVRLDVTGNDISDGPEWYELSGFYGENAAFFEDLRAGRRPAGDLQSGRQSVAVAQCIRERRLEYVA